jgi:predicted dehydrogenase
VLIEKPACATSAQARTPAEAAAAAGVMAIAAARCPLRCDVQWLLQRVAAIGRLERIELAWRRLQGALAKPWQFADTAGGWTSVFPDLGFHLVDLAGAMRGYPDPSMNLLTAEWIKADRVETAGWHGEVMSVACEVQVAARLCLLQDGVELFFDVVWPGEVDGDHTAVRAWGSEGALVYSGLFGCSTDHNLSGSTTQRLDRFGTVVETAAFPVRAGGHIAAFGRVLAGFREVFSSSDSRAAPAAD